MARWAYGAVLALVLPWVVPAARALDPQVGEAVEHLASLVVPEGLPARDESASRLYRTVYWLQAANRGGLGPDAALTMAARSVQRPLSEPCRSQLLADWRVAGSYGLLTPENLERMQEGLAPTATDGPFEGRRLEMGRLQGYSPFAADNLARVAFHPAGNPPPPEALAKGAVALPDSAYAVPALPPVQQWRPPPPSVYTPPMPMAGIAGNSPAGRNQAVYPPVPAPTAAAAGELPAIRPEQIQMYDIAFNDSLPLGGTRKLAVASDSGTEISVSVIGDGPKVRRTNTMAGPAGGSFTSTTDYARVDNIKVPKINPIRLPGIEGKAYLIHNDNTGRYYYIDSVFSNGGSFRIAKVLASR